MLDDWRDALQFDVDWALHTVGTPTATQWVRANNDGSQTVFIGTNFAFDANGVPTGGTVTQIRRLDFTTGSPVEVQRITNPGEHWQLTSFVTALQPAFDFRVNEIGQAFYDALQLPEPTDTDPIFEPTRIVDTLGDGTRLVILGSGFDAVQANGDLSLGTVTRIRWLDGTTVLQDIILTANPLNLEFVATAMFGDMASRLIYQDVITAGGVTVAARALPPSDSWWGNYALEGGAGNDTFVGLASTSPSFQGTGVDYDSASAGVTVDLATGTATGHGTDTLTNIRNVLGSDYNDLVIGNSLNNELRGESGNDDLRGEGGDDFLVGDDGDDTLNGGAGRDSAAFWANDVATGPGATVDLRITTQQNTGQGNDTLISIEDLHGSGLNDTFTGNGVDNGLYGGGGNDILNGAGGHDSIQGDDGNDRLIGAAGDDYLSGGRGNDRLTGNSGADSFDFSYAPAADNRDVVTDFSHADDTIYLNSYHMAELFDWHTWTLAEQQDAFYVIGSGPRDAEDRLIYNATSGALSYDVDGNGAAAPVVIAVLTNKPADLDVTDIAVYFAPNDFVV